MIGTKWLADIEKTIDPETFGKYTQYVATWNEHFGTIDRITGPAIEDFWRGMLKRTKRRTVVKQLYAIDGMMRWCKSKGYAESVPAYEFPPRSKSGTASPAQRAIERVPLSPEEAASLLAKLPEVSEKARKGGRGKWRPRDRFIVAWETALRPATLDALTAPGDYRKGATVLRVREEIDKAKFGREVPLTAAARAALDRCVPDVGKIFDRVDTHLAAKYLRTAAVAAKLPAKKAEQIKAYDLRHARITQLAESGNLVGVAYLAGHKAITTTNTYVHAHARAAVEVLKGTDSGRGRGKKKAGGKGRGR